MTKYKKKVTGNLGIVKQALITYIINHNVTKTTYLSPF
jgi:hypothetical protein